MKVKGHCFMKQRFRSGQDPEHGGDGQHEQRWIVEDVRIEGPGEETAGDRRDGILVRAAIRVGQTEADAPQTRDRGGRQDDRADK
jgi:hypothetical protein